MKVTDMVGKESVKCFPSHFSEVRGSVVNFVKVILVLTFLPIGTTDQLGMKDT